MVELTLEQKLARQSNYTRTFSWMFLGVLITGLVSYFLVASGLLIRFLYTFGTTAYMVLSIGLFLAQIAVATNFTRSITKIDASQLKGKFIFYAVLLGVSLSSIFIVYDIASIATAFFFAAILFASLVVTGFVMKLDLTKYSSYLFGGLLTLIGISIFSYFFRFPQQDLIIGLAGVVIFMGITIYDVQKMNKTYDSLLEQDDVGNVLSERYSIYFAFSLYLDFINLFIYILRLLNRRR